jgi:ACS family glucarate transporter-like MFS transporter
MNAVQSITPSVRGTDQGSGRPKRILGFLFLLSVVTYLDRVNISIATPSIQSEFHVDKVQMGVVFSAFVLGYMLFQVPVGWLGDRFGHKKVLTFALVWWSIFTDLTAWGGNPQFRQTLGIIGGFWIMRFLVGVGEAGAYPCANGIISHWFGPNERALAAGVMFAGIGIGSAITPPFVAWYMLHFGWRSAFHVSAAIGFVLAVALYFGIPNKRLAQHHLAANASVLKPKSRPAWRMILSSHQVWLLVTSIFFFGYVTYVFFFWFYPYLVDIRKISLLRSSFFTAMPFLTMALSAPLGGSLSDRLVPRVGKTQARRRVAMSGLMTAAVLIPTGAISTNAYLAVACLSLGAGAVYLAISAYFATAIDLFPQHSATVSGTMNTGAGLGGIVAPILTPYIANQFGWIVAFSMAGIFSLIAAILWRFVKVPDSSSEIAQ